MWTHAAGVNALCIKIYDIAICVAHTRLEYDREFARVALLKLEVARHIRGSYVSACNAVCRDGHISQHDSGNMRAATVPHGRAQSLMPAVVLTASMR